MRRRPPPAWDLRPCPASRRSPTLRRVDTNLRSSHGTAVLVHAIPPHPAEWRFVPRPLEDRGDGHLLTRPELIAEVVVETLAEAGPSA